MGNSGSSIFYSSSYFGSALFYGSSFFTAGSFFFSWDFVAGAFELVDFVPEDFEGVALEVLFFFI